MRPIRDPSPCIGAVPYWEVGGYPFYFSMCLQGRPATVGCTGAAPMLGMRCRTRAFAV